MAFNFITGDCVLAMAEMENESLDLIVTSPPYNRKVKYRSYRDDRRELEYREWVFEWAQQFLRLLKPEGHVMINVGSSGTDPWKPFVVAYQLAKAGLVLQNRIAWVKSFTDEGGVSQGHFRPITTDFHPNNLFEDVFHFTKSGRQRVYRLAVGVPFKDKSNLERFGHKEDLRCRGNVWFVPYKTTRKREEGEHPAQFPVELAVLCMLFSLGKGGGKRVMDPFLGEGSSAVAAKELGHEFVGIDLDGKYVLKAKQKVEGK